MSPGDTDMMWHNPLVHDPMEEYHMRDKLLNLLIRLGCVSERSVRDALYGTPNRVLPLSIFKVFFP